MGSYAHLTVDDYLVDSTKNRFDEWLFNRSDRLIMHQKISQRNKMIWGDPVEDDYMEQIYIYKIPARTLKRRLELQGWSIHSAEQEFIKSVAARLHGAEAADDELIANYPHHVSVLKNARFEDWLINLKQIIASKTRKRYEYEGRQIPNADPILDILLNEPYYQLFNDDIPIFAINWPCLSFEGFVRAVLEVVPDEAFCILDVSDLIVGGWTDEFEDLVDTQRKFTAFSESFATAIDDIKKLMLLDKNNQTLYRLLYANIITTMEAYLYDTIKKQIFTKPALERRFVENHDGLRGTKMLVADLYKKMDTIKDAVNEIIDKMTYHNLPVVRNIYKSVLDIDIPEKTISSLTNAINIRHDIIHRNGKNKSGELVLVTESDLEALVNLVSEVVREIDKHVIDGLLDDAEDSD